MSFLLDVTCFNVTLTTKKWADEIGWSVDTCSSNKTYKNNKVYERECCLEAGEKMISCNDTWGDGWNGGYLEINGEKYCNDSNFIFKEEIITIEDVSSGKTKYFEKYDKLIGM